MMTHVTIYVLPCSQPQSALHLTLPQVPTQSPPPLLLSYAQLFQVENDISLFLPPVSHVWKFMQQTFFIIKV